MKLAYSQCWSAAKPIRESRDDITRCQAVVDRYTEFAKKYASREQYKRSLEILLPTSTIYEYLEGRIPNPAYSYMRIADITEADEKEKINWEIGERRTRLGAKLDQVVTEVKREIYQTSDLESLYASIIDWTDDDGVRRQYEEKLLQHAYDTLVVLEGSKKNEKREQVLSLSQGLVILKHPFALAWSVVLEWKDVNELDELDSGLLTEYILHFPDDGLSKVFQGYLESEISPFDKPTITFAESQEDRVDSLPMSAEDRLIMMTEGMEECSNSVLSHRVMGEYFLYLDEHESAATIARQAQNPLQKACNVSGLSFKNSADAINIILARAFVHYKAPRHHPEARSLFDNVLQHKPTHTPALIGVGLILEEQEDYPAAIDFLERALERVADPKIKAEVAWCRAHLGNYDTGIFELEACLTEMQGSDIITKTLRSQTLYRIGICIWERDTSKSARKDRSGAYARFISSIQADLNNAPAYTSLGIYYADYAKDHKRARKCFQKAFELSTSEVDAAERLARSFASSAEWDLVEIVAQRVIESGKISSVHYAKQSAPGSKKKGISWPFTALGVVQLNELDYSKSIVSFQSALRSSPDDYHSWVGLGESYQNSGRFIAATRAFEQAQRLTNSNEVEIADSWFCSYMLANVKRELGENENAVAGYREVLKARPAEFGVYIALLQTLIDSAWRSIELGFFGQSAIFATEAIDVALDILDIQVHAFDLWKAVSDACSTFSWAQAYAKDFPVQKVRALLEASLKKGEYELLSDFDGVNEDVLQKFSTGKDQALSIEFPVQAAILANKRAIRVCANDFHARATAWYNLGWTEYRAYVCLVKETDSGSGKKTLNFLKASVQCFKRAIELEAGNSEFWNSLGIVTAALNPKVSQHSFVRSLHLNDRSAKVWTNLGTLYLIQNDKQLANDAFSRAQSTDPDYAQAWLGQGILAAQLGDIREAYTIFTHAFEIATASSTAIMKQYALSAFDYLLSSPSSKNNTSILQPRLALHQLHCQQPANLASQHLLSLFDERAGDSSSAAQILEKICLELEIEYEASESTRALARFSQAKSDLSRVQLAEENFTSAAGNAEVALDLSAGEEPQSPAHKKYRLSAHMTAGLAYYYQGSMDLAINMFRSALEETQGDPHIICLLAQVLWAKGGHEERTVAREQLLDCVNKYPRYVDATNLLGAIAILEDDRDMIEAISEDLQSFQARDDLTSGQERQISQLLNAVATLCPGEEGAESSKISAATTAVMLSPSHPQVWAQLAELGEEIYPAEMAVLTAVKAVPPGGSLSAKDLCQAYAGTRRVEDAQTAIMVAPWMSQGWEAFS